jgi:nucleotide-binding universal stress UspA family protein
MKARQKKIIVPVDFTPSSDCAIDLAMKFALLHGSEVVFVHALESLAPLSEFFADNDLLERKRVFANRLLDKIIAERGGKGISTSKLLFEGKPYKVILDACEEVNAEMIVMGTWGTHAIESGMIGSNVNKVVRGASVPVVTVSRPADKGQIDKILVAVDPEFGIRELRQFLQAYSKVYNPVVELISIAFYEKDVDELRRYLQKQSDALHQQGIVNVQITVRVGGIISDAILAYAKEGGHDMIWMETHGRTGIAGWLLGSVTEEVLQFSPVPVLSLHPEREVLHTTFYHSNLPI